MSIRESIREPDALRTAFEARFGQPPSLAARAPGRVNLIGEHTDYNDGRVLPCAIDRDVVLLAAPAEASSVRVYSREQGETRGFDPAAPAPVRGWTDHLHGVARARAARGLATPGLDILLASDVPLGSGLSSSAAVGVAAAALFDLAAGTPHGEPREWAALAHESENDFVGVATGTMDQLASALGRRDHALGIDCRDGALTPVAFPGDRLSLLVVHSEVERKLAEGAYNQRRAQCETAVVAARDAGLLRPPARALRDLPAEVLPELQPLVAETVFRRARHVVSEIARVEAFARALEAGEHGALGAILRAGQDSLRDDYAVSVPALDLLCEAGAAHPGILGSRLTGAGFGGCTVHLVHADAAEDAEGHLGDAFEAQMGRRPRSWRVRPWHGAEAAPLV